MQNDDGQQPGRPPAAHGGRGRNGPHEADSRGPVVRRGGEPVEPARPGGPVELVPTYRLPPTPPPPSRLPLVVVAVVAVLLVVIGVLVGLLLAGGRDPVPTAAAPTSTPSTPPPTSAQRGPATAAPTAARPTNTVAPSAAPAVSDQVRVTPGGQDLDLLNGDGDEQVDVQFSASDNEFVFYQPTARWTGTAAPTAEECQLEVERQPLSLCQLDHTLAIMRV